MKKYMTWMTQEQAKKRRNEQALTWLLKQPPTIERYYIEVILKGLLQETLNDNR